MDKSELHIEIDNLLFDKCKGRWYWWHYWSNFHTASGVETASHRGCCTILKSLVILTVYKVGIEWWI